MKKEATDDEHLRRAKAGDMAAFEHLVKKYEPQVAATVIGMLGPCQAAEDVGQEVFIRFYKYMQNFREDSALGTYLTRIAINSSLNELRKRKRWRFFFRSSDNNEVSEPASHPDEARYANETQRLVHQAIQKLAPEFRAVIVLRLIEGYSTEETAKILNIPLGTVLSRLSRAQQKLKVYLMPYVQEEI